MQFVLGMIMVSTIVMTLSSCMAPNFDDHIEVYLDRKRGVPPESEWNGKGIWYRVDGEPPTYLPVGYAAGLPRTDKEGVWVIDERESPGKRIFVPHRGSKDYSHKILLAEATKASTWRPYATKWELEVPLLH